MKLRVEQIPRHLAQGLAPIYLLAGDEPLQLLETADAIRRRARELGYAHREVLRVDSAFDWGQFVTAGENLSLFSRRRLVELHLATGKPTASGAAALNDYAQRVAEDTVLLISSGKLDAAAQRSAWLRALDTIGVIIQVWPIEGARLIQWLARRLHSRGLHPDAGALQLLADRVQGNLLAAAQEIERLAMLHGEGHLDQDTLAALVANSARFDVFSLLDRVLEGSTGAVVRVLNGLRMEGVKPVQVLGGLTFEIRRLCNIIAGTRRGVSIEQQFKTQRIWPGRQNTLRKVLKSRKPRDWQLLLLRCASIEQMVKGLRPGDPWEALNDLCLEIAAGTRRDSPLEQGLKYTSY